MTLTRARSVAWWLLTSLWALTLITPFLLIGNLEADSGIFLALAAYGLVGALVARRHPENPIGWVFLGVGALTGLNTLGPPVLDSFIESGGDPSPLQLAFLWFGVWSWFPMIYLATSFTVLLFPNGLASRRWRPVLWLAIVSVGGLALMGMLSPTLHLNGMEGMAPVDNPLSPLPPQAYGDAESWESWPPAGVLLLGAAIAMVAGLVSILIRFRRSTGVERLQLRWFALAVSLLVLWITLLSLVDGLEESLAGPLGVALTLAFIPVACGIAILKYGLYEIDRIISRTVAYLLVTAVVIGTYALVVTSAARFLPSSSNLAVAAATLAAAGIFRPVLGRVQGRVDRRFNRASYDAERTIDAYVAGLREGVDLQVAAADLLGAIDRTLEPASVGVWLRTDAR